MITDVYRGFSGGPGRVGRLIRRLDRVKWSDGKKHPPVINHVYRRFEFDDRPALIAESHFRGGVQLTPAPVLVRAVHNGKVDHVYEKKIDLTQEQKAQLWRNHEALHGDSYDLGLILAYWTWLRLGKRDPNRRFVKNAKNRKWTCNEYHVATGAGIEPDLPQLDLRLTPELLFILTFGLPSGLYAAQHGAFDSPLFPPETGS